MKLHVYRNNVIEWVVAESHEQAVQQIMSYYENDLGEKPEDWDPKNYIFVQEPDDKLLVMYDESDDMRAEKTCAEWAAECGLGLLGSTEW